MLDSCLTQDYLQLAIWDLSNLSITINIILLSWAPYALLAQTGDKQISINKVLVRKIGSGLFVSELILSIYTVFKLFTLSCRHAVSSQRHGLNLSSGFAFPNIPWDVDSARSRIYLGIYLYVHKGTVFFSVISKKTSLFEDWSVFGEATTKNRYVCHSTVCSQRPVRLISK